MSEERFEQDESKDKEDDVEAHQRPRMETDEPTQHREERERVAAFLAPLLELLRQPREHGELALVGERRLRAPGALEQVESDRGLAREQAEEIHLLECEASVARP